MPLLVGKVAVITGSGRGLGREYALAFAREGARVVVNDTGCARNGVGHDPAVAEMVAAEIRAVGLEAEANAWSITDPDGPERIVEHAVRAFGGVDILVNNAGITRDATVARLSPTDFDAVIDVTLRATFRMAQCVARRMIEQKRGGRMVNTVAVAGMVGNYGQVNLAAATAGVYAVTRTLAIELRKHAISVNALAPLARTRMTEDLPMFQGLRDETYGPRFVAPAAVFLASDLAGELSGEVLAVAGNRLSVFRMTESAGITSADPSIPWTPTDISVAWPQIAGT